MNATTAKSHETAFESFEAGWQEWHAAHERHRAHPHGFLAVTDLPGETLELEQQALPAGETVIGPIAERGGLNLRSGQTVIELAKRGGEYILRPRNRENGLLRNYQGTPAYSPDATYAVRGTYVPFEVPRPTTVGAAVEGVQHVYEAPDEIRFKLAGQELTLTAFNGHAPGSLLVLFTDQTSGETTYAANRSLSVVPAADGSVELDFNRAVNLPCAYTDLATCPLPPTENRLPVPIEAGEKIPYERQDQQ